MRKKYEVAIFTRDIVISLIKKRRNYSDREIEIYKDIFMIAKKYILEDIKFFIEYAKLANLDNLDMLQKIFKYENKINILKNTHITRDDVKNYEYVIKEDFNIISTINSMEESCEKIFYVKNTINQSQILKQLEIFVETVSLFNKTITIICNESLKRKHIKTV